MIPFQPDRAWYGRYWWDEGPGRVQVPLLRALIAVVAERILSMFRPGRGGNAMNTDAGQPAPRNRAAR